MEVTMGFKVILYSFVIYSSHVAISLHRTQSLSILLGENMRCSLRKTLYDLMQDNHFLSPKYEICEPCRAKTGLKIIVNVIRNSTLRKF